MAAQCNIVHTILATLPLYKKLFLEAGANCGRAGPRANNVESPVMPISIATDAIVKCKCKTSQGTVGRSKGSIPEPRASAYIGPAPAALGDAHAEATVCTPVWERRDVEQCTMTWHVHIADHRRRDGRGRELSLGRKDAFQSGTLARHRRVPPDSCTIYSDH